MSLPGAYDLYLYRGDTHGFQVALWQDTAATIPVDLTGATVAAEIRDVSAGTIIVPLIVAVTTPNLVDVSMTPAMFVGCPAKGVWDLQVTFLDATVRTMLRGAVTVSPDVTDSLPIAGRR